MSLTYGYNRVSGADVQAQVAATPSTTIFSHVNVTNINMSPDVDTTMAVVSSAQQGPASQRPSNNEAKVGLNSAKDNIQNTKTAAVDAIKSAQAEIIAAARANGVNEGEVFPDTSIAPDSVAELFISAVPEIKGGGSLATHMLNSSGGVGLMGDIANGMRDRPQEEVLATIRETLEANSGQQQNDSNTFAGLIVNADEAPTTDALRVDWSALLEEHPDALEEIMYFNENDPGAAWPELAELDALETSVDNKLGEIEAAEEQLTLQTPYTADGVEVAGELPPAEMVGAEGDDPMSLGRIAIASLDASERDRIVGSGKDLSRDEDSVGFDREAELLALARTGATLDSMAGA